MTVTVFTWDMFKFGKNFGVGHAALHVHGPHGNIYISFWPAEVRSPSKALLSTGKVHFMSGDKAEDGGPSWASKPIENLDEKRIIEFWNGFDLAADLDYKGSASQNVTKPNDGEKLYNLLLRQCSTTVVCALLCGADLLLRLKIISWLAVNAGTNTDFAGNVSKYLPGVRLPTITPGDVRELVKWVWDDS